MKQNIIVALFNISSEAYQAFSELKLTRRQQMLWWHKPFWLKRKMI